MAGLDLRRLAPADAAAALRSFPRRFRTLLTDLEEGGGDRPDDLFHRPGPDGQSAIGHAHAVVGLCRWGAQALHATTVLDQPDLPALPAGTASADRPVDEVIAELSEECEALAQRVRSVPPAEWNRPALTAEGKPTNALGVIRSVVGQGVEHLRQAELTIRALKGRA